MIADPGQDRPPGDRLRLLETALGEVQLAPNWRSGMLRPARVPPLIPPTPN